MRRTSLTSAAALLGSRGGKANTPAQQAARRRRTGQPRKYRLDAAGGLQKRRGDTWMDLEPPYSEAAQAALRRLKKG